MLWSAESSAVSRGKSKEDRRTGERDEEEAGGGEGGTPPEATAAGGQGSILIGIKAALEIVIVFDMSGIEPTPTSHSADVVPSPLFSSHIDCNKDFKCFDIKNI